MQNAHLSMGILEFRRSSANISTHIRVHVDRYIGDKEQCYLISVFGGDAEIGAISAAVSEQSQFALNFPDGQQRNICLGEAAVAYRGALTVQNRKNPLRHMVAVAQAIQHNGSAGRTFMVNYHPDLAWNTLVSTMGIPATPEWGPWILGMLNRKKRIQSIDGIGCDPVCIAVTREELLKWVEDGVRAGYLPFPQKNGPIFWPQFDLTTVLSLPAPDISESA
jgi:hypothetical protein